MKTPILVRIIGLLAILNTSAVCSQTPVQSRTLEYSMDEIRVAFISCQNIDSIPVLVVKECKDYIFSEEFAFYYQLAFENKTAEIEDGSFIEYSMVKRANSELNKKSLIINPLSKLSDELGLLFYAIVDEQFFQ